MFKKITAFLAAVMITVSAVGCSDGGNTANASQGSAENTSAVVSAAEKKSASLSNPNATKEAKALFDYICETYRNGIISGQQESTWMGSDQYDGQIPCNSRSGLYER